MWRSCDAPPAWHSLPHPPRRGQRTGGQAPVIRCCHRKGPISLYSNESQMTSSNFKRTGRHHPLMFREGEGNSVLVSNNVFHNFALVIKNPPANAGNTRCGFNPWVEKIPWRRAWQPTPVFLPEESHGLRSLAGYIVHRVTKSWTRLKQLSRQAGHNFKYFNLFPHQSAHL